MSASKTIGGINVTISATTEKFSKGVSRARGELKTFAKQMNATTLGIKSFGAALVGGVSVGAMANFTKQGIEQISTMVDLSDKLGISTEKLGGYMIAAEDSSVSASTFERSMLKMTKSIRDSTMGLGTAAKAYERLGLNVDMLNRMAPDEQLLSIMDAMKGVTDENKRLNLTMDLFGTKGSDMVRLLDQGRTGMAKFQEQARLTGRSIKDDVARQVEAAGDSIAKFERARDSLKLKAAIAATPAITAADEALTGMMLNKGDMPRHAARMYADVMGPLGWLVREGTRSIPFMGKAGLSPNVGLRSPLEPRGLFKNHGDGSALPVAPKLPENLVRLDELVNSIRTPLERFAKMSGQSWLGAGKSLGGSMWEKLREMSEDAYGSEAKKPASRFRSRTQYLAAQDPLSREGNSQRVRSLAQNGQKIAEKQLTTQQQMLAELRKGNANAVQFLPMGL